MSAEFERALAKFQQLGIEPIDLGKVSRLTVKMQDGALFLTTASMSGGGTHACVSEVHIENGLLVFELAPPPDGAVR